MEIKPAGNIPYREKVWKEYKMRLANTLREKALDCDEIVKNPEAKSFITSYVNNELMDEKKDRERLLLNTNIRLANMDIETSNGKKVYPLINEYKGHHLMKSYYFYKEEDSIKIGCVEVNPKPTIILP